jgi:cytochrome P450
MSMTLRNILFDPEIFPSPNNFQPDRWLEAEKLGVRLDRYLVTFAKGSRQCLGMNVAYSEMYLGIAALVSRFDMELHDFDPKRDLDIVRDCFIGLPSKESKGVRVNVSVRG